jgi:hypothetical protein
MPRLSLWSENKRNDYKYLDRIISEQYTVGGMDMYIHKYLGPKLAADSGVGDATQPIYDETNPLFIEDLFTLENRDRDYDESIYRMRGIYNVQDLDFNLSQFGLFLQNDTLFITFHYNDMIDTIGRKLMNGDVIELPNLKDFHPLDPSIPIGLPKFYVIQDASFAAEGFSKTWMPHIWRVKAVPMVGSQEYKDITDGFINQKGEETGDLTDYLKQCGKNLDINDRIVAQAEVEVPLSGYDVTKFYVAPYSDGEPADGSGISVDEIVFRADSDLITADRSLVTPESAGYLQGYLTGDSDAPNGVPVTTGVAFPSNPNTGDYCLRLDYAPNRMFRYDGKRWVKVEDDVRTELSYLNNDNTTQRSSFVNNRETINTTDRGTIPSRQSLSDLLKPEADN